MTAKILEFLLKYLKLHEIKRAAFMGSVMASVLLVAQFLGYESMWLTGAVAGICGGTAVILFPDPDFKP